MNYSVNNSKVVFNNNGVYIALTQCEMASIIRLLPKAQTDLKLKCPSFSSPHWAANGDGTFTTTKRRM
jgi:hypothetical protein